MSLWFAQFKAVLWKCFLINFRGRQFIKESIIVLVLGSIICVIENFQPNNFITPFYLAISILGYARYSAMAWVSEKETRQKQLQKIMGLSQAAYLIGWLTYFILNGLFITILMLCFLVFGVIGNGKTVFAEGYNWVNIAVIFFLYTVAVIGFTMTISTFFNKAKTAAQASSFIQLIGSLLFFLRFSQDFDESRPLIFLTAILPQQAFNMGVLKIAFLDPSFRRFTPDFSYEQGCYSLAFLAVFYIFLSIYLDQIWPNQIGTQKHPLFFINWIWRRRANSRRNHQNNPLMEQLSKDQQQLQSQNSGNQSSAKYEQPVQRKQLPLIKMKNVGKQFGDKKAVNNVTLNFYQKQIFCLLGHNGAGKSTTINILTGMLQHNSGSIELMGMNYKDNLTEIRTNIGLCLQYNVLYDLLTIQEHLQYYARIKGKSKQQAQPEIQKVIVKCALDGERGKFAKNLSGGNKRKLCLANALIGQSKLIFLDEPSSGLDPNSRRAIWDIMKSLTEENRCVILTTHHLQQAQALSQRIGIMSQGKLVIVGDDEFIKKKFNVGYHLIVTLVRKNQQQDLKKCKQIVHRHFKDCKQDDQTASNTVKFILGEGEVANFSQGFQQLQKAGIGQLSLKVSNLEDAFIKLGTQQTQGEGVIPDIPDVEIPNVVCRYSFTRQFRAVFTKKSHITFRTLSSLFSIVLPLIFIIAGFIVAVLVIGEAPGQKYIFQWLKRYIMSYFMTLAFAFNTSAYCGSIVLDREKRFKYLSNVMGLRKLPYWTANYAFDSLIFLIPLIPFFILMYTIEEAVFLRQVLYLLIPLLVIFCFAFIGYSYFFSFIFQKSNTAYRLFPILNFIVFYSILQIPQFIDKKSFIAIYVTPIISPFIAFSNAFQTKQFFGGQDFERLGLFVANLPICFIGLAFQAILFPILTLFMESIRFNMKDKQQLDEHQRQQNQNVEGERRSYEQGMINKSIKGSSPILIDHLCKKYSNGYVAIRNNSFKVAEKQIFGLLGPNGAGKSTTFNIITAALPKTSGTVKILEQDVNRGIMQIFQNVGVCPQYDALYQIMTTEQHMQYFARLKGLSQQQIQKTLNFYYELLSLTPYVKVQSQKLSGGNKRKLCVSMAMLANPSIMFFDQPSAGVDPISRRYLWKALSLSVKNFKTSMVLTTHSMNQAESLCNRIGILIKGQFIAQDTPKNLTLKYGKGFRIEVYCSSQDKKEEIKKIFGQQFGDEINFEEIPQSKNLGLLFVIPSSRFNLSSAYGLCQNRLLMKEKKIVRYHIAQSTLQEVFIHLSRMQPQVLEQQIYKQPWQCLCWQFGATGCMCLV